MKLKEFNYLLLNCAIENKCFDDEEKTKNPDIENEGIPEEKENLQKTLDENYAKKQEFDEVKTKLDELQEYLREKNEKKKLKNRLRFWKSSSKEKTEKSLKSKITEDEIEKNREVAREMNTENPNAVCSITEIESTTSNSQNLHQEKELISPPPTNKQKHKERKGSGKSYKTFIIRK